MIDVTNSPIFPSSSLYKLPTFSQTRRSYSLKLLMSIQQLKARFRLLILSDESSDDLTFGFNDDSRYSDNRRWSSSWTRL